MYDAGPEIQLESSECLQLSIRKLVSGSEHSIDLSQLKIDGNKVIVDPTVLDTLRSMAEKDVDIKSAIKSIEENHGGFVLKKSSAFLEAALEVAPVIAVKTMMLLQQRVA